MSSWNEIKMTLMRTNRGNLFITCQGVISFGIDLGRHMGRKQREQFRCAQKGGYGHENLERAN